jgi:hypothetical protein
MAPGSTAVVSPLPVREIFELNLNLNLNPLQS